MHASLDSALGRQRRLNSVGESVLQIAPNAAAAYSLRSLTGGDPTVVRVRRGSDNHEQDFTASEVSAGALTSFVNAQVVAPLDIQALEADGRTGDFLIAKAAYSLRSLGTRQATLAATGDTVARADGKFVCQVRRASDDTIKSFTADEVTDGTLRNFCLNDDADIISFADAGLAGSPAADKRMYFDGVNDSVSLGSNVVLAGDFEIESKLLLQSYDIVGFSFPCLVGNGSTNRLFFSSGGTTLIFDGTNTAFGGVILPLNTLTTVKLKRTGTTVELFFDGVSKGTTTNSASFTIAFLGSRETTAGLINGFIYDLSITSGGTLIHSYKGYGNTSADWEDQTGSNNGTVAGSPALFTGQGFDGFVKTWYDQSVTNEAGDTATGNHATQATAASQPKIVSAGALVSGGLDFDGSDDFLTNSTAIMNNAANAYASVVLSRTSTTSNEIPLSFPADSTGNRGFDLRLSSGTTSQLSIRTSVGSSNASGSFATASGSNVLLTGTFNAGLSSDEAKFFGNGSLVGSASNSGSGLINNGDNGGLFIGRFGSPTNFGAHLNGKVEEVIVYDTDQTDNRTAIEANIGEAYSIDLPSGVDPGFDQVDGFVETWYDQSGSSNNLTQATASKQPTIVSGGTLNTRNSEPIVKFIQANATFLTGASSIFPTGTDIAMTVFHAMHIDASSGDRIGVFGHNQGGNNPGTNRYLTGSAPSLKTISKTKDSSDAVVSLQSDALASNDTDAIVTYMFSMSDGTGTHAVFNLGSQVGSTQTGSITDQSYISGDDVILGARATADNFSDSEFFEVIVYASDQLSNRDAIESNLSSQYGIALS